MTLPRLEEMSEYWNESPPVNETFAAFIGLEPPKTGSMEDLLAEFGINPDSVGQASM